MNKSSKPTIIFLFLLLLIITAFALVSVSIKLKYEQTVLLNDAAQKQLKIETQKKIKLTAEYQTVTAEERIVKIASSELGLIRNIETPIVLKYDINKVEKIDEEIKRKYD